MQAGEEGCRSWLAARVRCAGGSDSVLAATGQSAEEGTAAPDWAVTVRAAEDNGSAQRRDWSVVEEAGTPGSAPGTSVSEAEVAVGTRLCCYAGTDWRMEAGGTRRWCAQMEALVAGEAEGSLGLLPVGFPMVAAEEGRTSFGVRAEMLAVRRAALGMSAEALTVGHWS